MYRLKLPTSWKIHNVFHVILLRPFTENEVHGNNFPRPAAELLEGEEVYTVERILKHRRRRRGYQFYVISYYRSLMGTGVGIFRRR